MPLASAAARRDLHASAPPSKGQQLREQAALEADARSVEDAATRAEDYLDTLDAAFDTLDQQLSGPRRRPRSRRAIRPARSVSRPAPPIRVRRAAARRAAPARSGQSRVRSG